MLGSLQNARISLNEMSRWNPSLRTRSRGRSPGDCTRIGVFSPASLDMTHQDPSAYHAAGTALPSTILIYAGQSASNRASRAVLTFSRSSVVTSTMPPEL